MDTWPISLQQKFDVDGFQKKIGRTKVATDMDIGPAKVRSRFTDAVDGYECQIRLDYSEMATFETFYKTTLGNGTLPFLFDDPFTGLKIPFRFSPESDPVIRPLGGRVFIVTMSWEKLP